MHDVLQLATLIGYVLEAGLWFRVFKRRGERPCFVALVGLLLVTSGLEFVCYYTRGFSVSDYARAYWKLTALEIAASFAVLCECLDCRKIGIGAGVALGILLWLLNDISAFALAGTALALLAGIAFTLHKQRQLTLGLTIFWLPWIVQFLPALPNWALGIPVFSWVLALLTWFFVPLVTEN